MDVVLLSKLVRDLLCSNDKVSLPGLGLFSFEDVPASFSDKGFTINPPYRKVVFNLSAEYDALVAQTYASANNIPLPRAERIVDGCIAQMASSLKMTKCVVMPDFGKLKMTRAGIVFFVAEEGLYLQPRFDLLQSVSLKSITPSSVQDSETAVVTTPATVPAPAAVPTTDVVAEKHLPVWAKATICISLAAAAFFLFLAIAGRVKPSLVDPLLYDEEELAILNTRI